MKITRKSIRISSVTEALLKRLKPDLAQHGPGYIVDVIAHEQSGMPSPLPPDQRRQIGAKKRGKKLKGKPALNPHGRRPKEPRESDRN